MHDHKAHSDSVTDFLNYLSLERRYSRHTLMAYSNDIGKLQDYLGSEETWQWKEVDEFVIRSWIVDAMNRGEKPRSVHRRLAAFNTFFNYLCQKGLIQRNPIERIQKPKMVKELPEIMREDEMLRLFEESEFEPGFQGLRDRLILELLYGTGLRLSELIALPESGLRNGGSSIQVVGKRNKERLIPLHKELQMLLQDYMELRKGVVKESVSEILLTNMGQKLYPKFVYRLVNMYLGKVTSRSKKSPHVLRHSFATHLLNKGADLNAIKELLGHANLAATQVYTHNSIEELKRVFNQSHPRGGHN